MSEVSSFFTSAAPYAKAAASRVVGMFAVTPIVQWADETGYNMAGSPPGSLNLAGIDEVNYNTIHGFATLDAFVTAWVATIEDTYYGAVRAATSIEAQLLALGESPWAGGHYIAEGSAVPGSALLEIYSDNKTLIDGLVGTQRSEGKVADTVPTLKSGNTGTAVKVLQVLLNERIKAGLTVDGQFGSGTETAVNVAKKAAGLGQDGIAGVALWAWLVE